MRTCKSILVSCIIMVMVALGCKSLAKSAAKHWTKKQLKEFRQKCEEGTLGKLGKEKAPRFCKCAGTLMEQKYPSYEDAKGKSIMEILSTASECINKE